CSSRAAVGAVGAVGAAGRALAAAALLAALARVVRALRALVSACACARLRCAAPRCARAFSAALLPFLQLERGQASAANRAPSMLCGGQNCGKPQPWH